MYNFSLGIEPIGRILTFCFRRFNSAKIFLILPQEVVFIRYPNQFTRLFWVKAPHYQSSSYARFYWLHWTTFFWIWTIVYYFRSHSLADFSSIRYQSLKISSQILLQWREVKIAGKSLTFTILKASRRYHSPVAFRGRFTLPKVCSIWDHLCYLIPHGVLKVDVL